MTWYAVLPPGISLPQPLLWQTLQWRNLLFLASSSLSLALLSACRSWWIPWDWLAMAACCESSDVWNLGSGRAGCPFRNHSQLTALCQQGVPEQLAGSDQTAKPQEKNRWNPEKPVQTEKAVHLPFLLALYLRYRDFHMILNRIIKTNKMTLGGY